MMSYPITQRMISSSLKTLSSSEIKVISSAIKELERTGITGITGVKQTHISPLTINLKKTHENSRNNEKADIAKMLFLKLKPFLKEEGENNRAYLPD